MARRLSYLLLPLALLLVGAIAWPRWRAASSPARELARVSSPRAMAGHDTGVKSAASVSPSPGSEGPHDGVPSDPPAPSEGAHAATYSNVLPTDYIGPKACAECHRQEHRDWSQHPHSRMNQNPSTQSVRGDFSGVRIDAGPGKQVLFDRGPNGSYRMTLLRDGKELRSYEVTRTIGSRYMQFYVGRQVRGPEEKTHPLYTLEHKLPYAYWFKIKRWLPEYYFDQVGPEVHRNGDPIYEPFDKPVLHDYTNNCMRCHNTYAYVYKFAIPPQGAGFPRHVITFPAAVAETTKGLGHALTETGPNLLPNDLIALGVSCESCHFGGRAHAEDGVSIVNRPTHPSLSMVRAGGAGEHKGEPEHLQAEICAQCHTAGSNTYPNGAGAWNSREAKDLLAGSCNSQIKCTDCHHPHKAGQVEGQPDAPARLAKCTQCHSKYQNEELALAHGGHGSKAKLNCMDCHMPRISQGIDELVRSHTISSPTDARMLSTGSPNACNTCHLDKPITWTVATLNEKWGKHLEVEPSWAKAYGELSTPVGKAWLHSSNQSVRIVATQSYARSQQGKAVLKEVLASLDDPMPINRVFASFAVERITGHPLRVADYDPTLPPGERQARIAKLIERYSAKQ